MRMRTALSMAIMMAAFAAAGSTHAQLVVPIDVVIQNGQFQPAEISTPADAPFALRVKNLDPNAVEVASAMMRFDRLVSPNTSVIVQLGKLQPGRYTFYDVARSTTHGVVIVQ